MTQKITPPVYVTRPALPPLEELMPYLQKIWDTRVLTNCGPFHQELEQALCEYLGVKHICLFANATIALVTALKALRIEGEVITTPYSFVARPIHFYGMASHRFLLILRPIPSTLILQKLRQRLRQRRPQSCLFIVMAHRVKSMQFNALQITIISR